MRRSAAVGCSEAAPQPFVHMSSSLKQQPQRPTTATAKIIPTMLSSLLLLLLLSVTTEASSLVVSSSSLSSQQQQTLPMKSFRRFLEENQGEDWHNQQYYTIHQGHCFRMKIVNEDDGDGDNNDDGNTYFYNGAYRAQYKRYISYQVCPNNADGSISGIGGCHEYVTTLEDYLEQTVPYVQAYCTACSNSCRRRRLEDAQAAEQEQQYMTVNCNLCVNECKNYNNYNYNGGLDESNYIGCQAAAANNNNGNNNGGEQEGQEQQQQQYYTAPQCENDRVVIGHFYDEECTIKTSTLVDDGFSYRTFQTIAGLTMECNQQNQNGGQNNVCKELLDGEAIDCAALDGDNDAQEVKLCKAAASAGRIYTYYKKPFYQKIHMTLIVALSCIVLTLFGFLSYTYYVRHYRTNKSLIPMSQLDDLPPLT